MCSSFAHSNVYTCEFSTFLISHTFLSYPYIFPIFIYFLFLHSKGALVTYILANEEFVTRVWILALIFYCLDKMPLFLLSSATPLISGSCPLQQNHAHASRPKRSTCPPAQSSDPRPCAEQDCANKSSHTESRRKVRKSQITLPTWNIHVGLRCMFI
jgi:hypothetical protein